MKAKINKKKKKELEDFGEEVVRLLAHNYTYGDVHLAVEIYFNHCMDMLECLKNGWTPAMAFIKLMLLDRETYVSDNR